MFRYGVSDSRVHVFGSNITQAHVPEGQPPGHPRRQCPSWLVGKELEHCVPSVGVLDLEVFHKLNRIVVSDNLLFMRAKILRQNMQQNCIGPFESQRRASAPVPDLYYRGQGEVSRSDPTSNPMGPKLRTSDWLVGVRRTRRRTSA